MYSDKWRKEGCHKKLRVHCDKMFLYDWYSEDGAHIGIGIDYEIADDVHYELKNKDWHKLLQDVIGEEDIYRPGKKTTEFLSRPNMHYELGNILTQNNIKYKKIAFVEM